MFVGLLNNYSKKNCFHEPCVQDAVFLRNRYEEASLGSNESSLASYPKRHIYLQENAIRLTPFLTLNNFKNQL